MTQLSLFLKFGFDVAFYGFDGYQESARGDCLLILRIHVGGPCVVWSLHWRVSGKTFCGSTLASNLKRSATIGLALARGPGVNSCNDTII